MTSVDKGAVVFIDLLCMIFQRRQYLIFPGFRVEFSQDVPAFVFERSCLTLTHTTGGSLSLNPASSLHLPGAGTWHGFVTKHSAHFAKYKTFGKHWEQRICDKH